MYSFFVAKNLGKAAGTTPSWGASSGADTVVPGAGNPQAFNRYSYVLNRPTGLVEPSGHEPIGCYNYANGQCTNQGGKPVATQTVSANTSKPTFLSNPYVVQFWNDVASFLNSIGKPQLYIQGVGGNVPAHVGGFEEVFDFSTNQVAFFAIHGMYIGSNEFSGGAQLYSGYGWKQRYKRVSIDSAYSGEAYSITGTINDLPIPFPSAFVTVAVSGAPGEEGLIPYFDRIVTITTGAGKSVDWFPSGGDIQVSGTTAELMFPSIRFSRDQDFIAFVWLSPNLSFSTKQDLTMRILTTQEVSFEEMEQ